ncbi:MAG TPA: ABC transporter ATP-binding protein [Actinomycetota bacterium]|nr:ABC transporter ATP-binding protein [Actinomycetota bacterium]
MSATAVGTGTPAVAVQALAKRYGDFRALSGLSFEVPRGEIFGFVGPNGAGKTTTLRILATLLDPTSGRAFIDGVDVGRDPYAVRDRMGYMPDFFGVYERLTAGEYLAFYARCYDIPSSRVGRVVADLLELIRLPDRRDTPVDALSRGMKQRLCLARALVHDPAVLLLDEPASGLDPLARVELRELLKELREMGKTILISSHILPELTELCTSFGIILGGRMLASGPLESLRSVASGRRVRVRVGGDVEKASELAAGIAGVRGVTTSGDTIEIGHEGGEEEGGALLRALIEAGIGVRAFTPVEEDLETAFLRVMGEDGSAGEELAANAAAAIPPEEAAP